MTRNISRFVLTTLLVGAAAGGSLVVAPGAQAALPATVALPDGIQPEGITSYGSTYWVGSRGDGRVVAGDLRGDTPARVLLPGASGRQLRGLAFDARTDLLWAVGNVGTTAHVWALNAFSGRVVRDTVVPGGVFLNDLVVTPTAVWVTDSRVKRLTKLTLTASGQPTAVSPAFLPLRGAWPGGEGAGNAANGIRVIDVNRVLLDHSGVGGLWSVDLRTGAARAVTVTGGPAITGGDGLERRGSTLWVVRGVSDASVSQLRLTITASTVSAAYVRTLTAPSLDVPSTATSPPAPCSPSTPASGSPRPPPPRTASPGWRRRSSAGARAAARSSARRRARGVGSRRWASGPRCGRRDRVRPAASW